jgi:PadR family transcriptional regulator AphA
VKNATSRYAVLGMLSIGSMSGYDIKKTISESIVHFWNESYGRIYPVLQELDAEGLATRKVERKAGKPDRQVYSITKAGERVLHEWLATPVAGEQVRSELLLKLFFGKRLTAPEREAHVLAARNQHQQLLKVYAATAAAIKIQKQIPDTPFWLITLDFGRRRSEAILAWCDDTLRELQKIARR